ncbi:MAG: histone, partial [Burkholderiaceae bacterium]
KKPAAKKAAAKRPAAKKAAAKPVAPAAPISSTWPFPTGSRP